MNPPRLKPVMPQQVWRWEIAVYLYLAGMGAGAFITGMLSRWNLFGFTVPQTVFTFRQFSVELSALALLWGPAMVAIGAPCLILDLGKKMKFYTACLNPKTSWLARGFIILSIFMAVGLTILGTYLLAYQWVLNPPAAWRLLEVLGIIFGIATALYTGILIKSTKFFPIWNTPFLPALFLVSALSTGSMGIILSIMGYELLFLSGTGLSHSINALIHIEQVVMVIEAMVLGLYLWLKFRMQGEGQASVRLLISGKLRTLFWYGIVLTGFGFPLTLEYLHSLFPQYPALIAAAGLSLFAGGLFLRLGILDCGIKEQIPMQRLIESKMGMNLARRGI